MTANTDHYNLSSWVELRDDGHSQVAIRGNYIAVVGDDVVLYSIKCHLGVDDDSYRLRKREPATFRWQPGRRKADHNTAISETKSAIKIFKERQQVLLKWDVLVCYSFVAEHKSHCQQQLLKKNCSSFQHFTVISSSYRSLKNFALMMSERKSLLALCIYVYHASGDAIYNASITKYRNVIKAAPSSQF